MRNRVHLLLATTFVLLSSSHINAADPNTSALELARYQNEFSTAKVVPARMNDTPGLAVIFQGTHDLHYYANSETAPGGFNLKIAPNSPDLEFAQPVFPKWDIFHDPTGKDVEVYVGNFNIFVPVTIGPNRPVEAKVTISGIACTSIICLQPFKKTLSAQMDLAKADTWQRVNFQKVQESDEPQATPPAVLPYSTPVYLVLAILAGISINIMPCVLPVIPLIMIRLIKQSGESDRKRITSGMAFCAGVILFFAAFALLSTIINLTTGAVLDLNSLFRYPAAVITLFLAIVFFALVLLDTVTLALPSALTNRQTQASGIPGSLGMGFFAGILSTPCSGALLGFVLVWAQTQPLLVSSAAIILMGLGMALPYAVIILIPSLLNRIPKPGNWMDIFKKSCGFLLFFIAVKLTLAALPKDRLLNVLTYGVIFGFCAWMWGKWVSFATPAARKWTVRLIALALALAAGAWLLPAKQPPPGLTIDWQSYDAQLVEQAASRGRPVLLKFTADWCTNCKVVERQVYQDQDVVRFIQEKNVLPIKADTTLNSYPATIDFKNVYGEAGNVPVTIILPPHSSQQKLRGIFDKQQLLKILESLPDPGETDGRQENT